MPIMLGTTSLKLPDVERVYFGTDQLYDMIPSGYARAQYISTNADAYLSTEVNID